MNDHAGESAAVLEGLLGKFQVSQVPGRVDDGDDRAVAVGAAAADVEDRKVTLRTPERTAQTIPSSLLGPRRTKSRRCARSWRS
ncbi:hypothetical protein [Nocardia sp. NPDC050175]|uniref:hypothetical protein n=1 Tax=Nocardia sp. NPDC050175 TaxID=3364317 RepID=UPI0037AF1691